MKKQYTKKETKKKIEEATVTFEEKQEEYAKEYDTNLFFEIIKRLPRAITENFMKLYYIIRHKGISKVEKAMCLAALGYVVFPLDLIPDNIPIVGFLDDAGVVSYVLHKLKYWSSDAWVIEQIEKFYA